MDYAGDSRIVLTVDERAEEFHITAGRDHSTAELARLLQAAGHLGLEPLDEEEHPEEVLEDDSVRVWLRRAHKTALFVAAALATTSIHFADRVDMLLGILPSAA